MKLAPDRSVPTAILSAIAGALFLLTASCVAQTSSRSGRIFDVRDFGAKGDGKTLDTEAIQKALDECGKAGGGTVRLTPGTYWSKPISLQSRTTLLLEGGAKLLASSEHTDFMKSPGDWLKAKTGDFVPLISGKDLTDIVITGQGTIDGAGEVWWAAAEEARRKQSGFTLPRPRLIVLTRCKNVKLMGVTLQNSPTFHFVPTECEDVLVDGVTILAPEHSANTDAIDPSVSRRVTIANCLIDVGDDNIAIKSGRKIPGREFACEEIVITNCVFKRGHGMSIGSETPGGVRNITVRDCTFEGTENGIRIKSPRGKGGTIENLVCENITMNNVQRALTITAYYPKIPKTDMAQPVTPETPIFKNISIRNLTASCYENAGIIIGLPESLVQNVALENVNITAAATGLEIRNARGIQLKKVKITAKEGEPFIVENAEVEGLAEATGTR